MEISRDEIRAAVAAQLGAGTDLPAEIADDDDLIQMGLNSMRMMALAGGWRKQGSGITFADLAGSPTIESWHALLGSDEMPSPATPEGSEPDPALEATPFPLATMLVNIAGSLIMGLFIGWLARTTPAWQADARLFFAVGVLGGFTTLSSFSLDTVTLLERGEIGPAALYVLGSVVVSIAALFVGLLVMRAGAA